MIELLLSLAILAVLTGFVAGGLSMGRRAFDVDRVNEIASEADVAIQVISSLIGSALPVQVQPAGQSANVAFDGRQEAISFVSLSEGRSLLGGPHKISLRRFGSDIVVNVMPSPVERKKEAVDALPREVAVLRGVREVRFRYFGRIKSSRAPSWRTDWFGSERLPDLVSIHVDFVDERRNQPAVIVALRQQ